MNTPLSTKEIESLLSLCWMAAHADGTRNDQERAEIKRLTEMVTSDPVRHDLLYTDVVAGIKTMEDLVAVLGTPALREKAYEMSSCVCGADKDWSKKERSFLEELRQGLGLDKSVADNIDRNIQLVFNPPPAAPAPVVAPKPAAPAAVPAAPAPTTAPAPGILVMPTATPTPAPTPASTPFSAPQPKFQTLPISGAAPAVPATPQRATPAEIDAVIRKNAILAGALETVADPMCNMSLPLLQKRLVARIGTMLGHSVDKNQGLELMQAAGLPTSAAAASAPSGSTEGAGGYLQKLFGGLLKKGGDAAGTGKLGFANTHAIGMLAKLYYSGNKTIAAPQLKEFFTTLVAQAKPAQDQAAGEIQRRASEIIPNQIGEIVAAV